MIDLKFVVIAWDFTTFIGAILSMIACYLAWGDWKAAKLKVRKKIAFNRLRSEVVKLWMMLSFFIVGMLVYLSGVREGEATYVTLILFSGVFLMMLDTAGWIHNRVEVKRDMEAMEDTESKQNRREVFQAARGEHQDTRQIHQDVREVHQDAREIEQEKKRGLRS